MEGLAAAVVPAGMTDIGLILAVPAATMSVETVIMDSLAAMAVGGLILAVPAAEMVCVQNVVLILIHSLAAAPVVILASLIIAVPAAAKVCV